MRTMCNLKNIGQPMRRLITLPVYVIALLFFACRLASQDSPISQEPPLKSEDMKDIFRYAKSKIRVSREHSFVDVVRIDGGMFGCGSSNNIREMEELARTSHDLILEIDETSPADVVEQLVSSYFTSHVSVDNLTMKYWDPEEKFEKYKAEVCMDKSIFFDDEPIMLTTEISGADASWRLFTPTNLRIRDENERDVNILLYPVTDRDSVMRSKVWDSRTKQIIDLTSFVEPYYGVEHIYKFSPGKYTATFYFYSHYKTQTVGLESYAAMGSRRWGKLHSNTISFEIYDRKDHPQLDIDELFQQASKQIDKNLPHDAVKTFKKIVSSSTEFSVIQKAIRNMILIRHIVRYDDTSRYQEKNLRTEMDNFVEKAGNNPNRQLESIVLSLSLLHVPMEVRKELICRYAKCKDSFWNNTPVDKSEEEFFKDFYPGNFFSFPQLRPILEEAIANPQTCSRTLRDNYLSISEQDFHKEPKIMLGFLRTSPSDVLSYYSKNKAPRELVPFIAQYFEDKTNTWGNGSIQANVMDGAFEAFEKAVGLNLGFPDDQQYDRIHYRDAIKMIVKRWWKLHAFEYGVTEDASDELILSRIHAMRQAHEARWGVVREVIEKDGRIEIDFDRKGVINVDSCGVREKIELAKDINVPGNLKKGVLAVICVTLKGDILRPERPEYVVATPNAIWAIPSKE